MQKQRKLLSLITTIYTLFILYCMFFAFGRGGSASNTSEYTFIFVPGNFLKLPTLPDLLPPTLMDLVSIGNIAAFIPFGILIPLLRPISFVRFLIGFLLAILILETVQALTFLGSFDLDDVLRNTLGACIGFAAYRIAVRGQDMRRKIGLACMSVAVLFMAVWFVGFGIDKAFAKTPAPFTAVTEKEGGSPEAAMSEKLQPFEIGGQKIVPEFNVYDSGTSSKQTYTYDFGQKQLRFRFQYGIPDGADFKGSISASVDGKEILSNSEGYQGHTAQIFEWEFEEGGVLTITVEGNEKVWDVGYEEMKHFWE
ncbi:VanZ family protein [Saccharibacillus sp. JS10]|uniref:VanZ family protein n=1 Tax=Saccharibacillus sp. JS10 TaxID=2950552 RepID=UPI00210BE97D|nr:VanZ family protein [Saccharibacillus sp. JS10]MCQ4088322.1 VanZ family protein [Saccharibacillus sp. JS10]